MRLPDRSTGCKFGIRTVTSNNNIVIMIAMLCGTWELSGREAASVCVRLGSG